MSALLGKLITRAGVSGACGLCAYGVASNTVWLIQNLDEVAATTSDPGQLVMLQQQVCGVAESLTTAPFKKEQSDNIHIFISKGISAMATGSARLPFGATLGVPRTFLCVSPNDPVLKGLRIGRPGADPDANVVKALLIPTLATRRFTIAHELGHVYYEDGMLNAVWDPLLILGGVSGLVAAAKRGPVATGVTMAVAVPVLAGVRASFKWLQELRADQFAVENGHQQGGEDYMTRKIELNQVMGNRHVDSSLRAMMTHPPLEFRLKLIRKARSAAQSVPSTSKPEVRLPKISTEPPPLAP